MKKLTFKTITLAVIIVLGACTKTEKGPQGDPGPAGANGNANVKSSTITLQSSNWSYGTGNAYAFADINWPTITQDIVDKGVVMVYIQTSTNTWAPLPFTIYGSTKQTLFDFVYTTNKVSLTIGFSDLSGISITGPYTFKIVAIAASGIVKGVDPKSYEAVKATYNLKD